MQRKTTKNHWYRFQRRKNVVPLGPNHDVLGSDSKLPRISSETRKTLDLTIQGWQKVFVYHFGGWNFFRKLPQNPVHYLPGKSLEAFFREKLTISTSSLWKTLHFRLQTIAVGSSSLFSCSCRCRLVHRLDYAMNAKIQQDLKNPASGCIPKGPMYSWCQLTSSANLPG